LAERVAALLIDVLATVAVVETWCWSSSPSLTATSFVARCESAGAPLKIPHARDDVFGSWWRTAMQFRFTVATCNW